ncbi:NAD-dependent protein deacetylase [Mangrovimicrobium sediminis]|uniref:protein acetyllysine N-acetyltransferase n=1 Tax=Mangrovimicrobium sediminis TaxID=2562682 RepID=A0A4Z0M2D7_9GAMM|nr:NAD-dependent protein deacetylase [Haliea sp. SAOS-164]TGD73616.1 NAD-dependent protein deacetylase [Haliea sp. SAOS-164]
MNSPEQTLTGFLQRHPRLVVLTGAGISAESGIPTYRDDQGRWLYRTPIQHQAFIDSELTRKRYWSRSLGGWPAVRDAQPNAAHRALAALEHDGRIELLITQNVDRLHQRAGSRRVIDLHGRVDRVRCLGCGALDERDALQGWLEANNAPAPARAAARPDGDSELPDDDTALALFKVPDCARCAGTLMPDVVFFGGNVPRARVDSSLAALQRADALLVIGSSLQVYSGYRFCRKAREWNKPIALLNPGKTRADDIADLKIIGPATALLARFATL